MAILLPWCASLAEAQSTPTEALGPYNAVFLPDGQGLKKALLAPAHQDPRTAALERLGLNRESEAHDGLQDGHAAWTLAFWFRSVDPLTGALLVAGIGDPGAEDARFIGIQDRHLALWLGRGAGSSKMITGDNELGAAAGHLAIATSDGAKVTLYADGNAIATGAQTQGDVAAQLQMAPPIVDGVTSHHFGGQICGLRVYREKLTAEQVKAMADAPPNFTLPTYEEASPHWAVQTRAMAGQTEPQNPLTLPRGKGGIQKPVARPLRASDLKSALAGENPWTITGGWKLAAAPQVKATGDEISKPGFTANDWMAATVPGTVLTTMIDRGVYPDPDYGLNNLGIPESLAHQDYWYRVEFKVPPSTRGQRLTLTFNGVNYAAEVWMNGRRLGGFTGAFLRGRFDVTSAVYPSGANVLAVRVSPPPHPGIAHEQSIEAGPGENGGIQVIDGPTFAATEGWDWIPGVRDRDTGIWKDVTLTATDAVEIGDLQVVTTLPREDRSEADLEIEVPLTNTSNQTEEGDLTASFDAVTVNKHLKLLPGETVVRLEPAEYAQLKVQNPKLWWPNGYGEPSLHALTVSFAEGGKQSAKQQIEFGIREVSYEISLFGCDRPSSSCGSAAEPNP